jgi:hypothetical protein
METKRVIILALKHSNSTNINNKLGNICWHKWQPFEGPLSVVTKTIDHMLPIIVVMMVGSSPLLNALLIWEILYSIKALCKHLHNKQQLGCQPIMKLKFHKC